MQEETRCIYLDGPSAVESRDALISALAGELQSCENLLACGFRFSNNIPLERRAATLERAIARLELARKRAK